MRRSDLVIWGLGGVLLLVLAGALLKGGWLAGDNSERLDRDNRGPIVPDASHYRGNYLTDDALNKVRIISSKKFLDAYKLSAAERQRLRAKAPRFSTLMQQQFLVLIRGSGDLETRAIHLATPPTEKLFDKDATRERSEKVVRGIIKIVADRHGYVGGFAFTNSEPGYQAATLAQYAEQGAFAQHLPPYLFDAFLNEALYQGAISALSTGAWYDPVATRIVFGPQVSGPIMRYMNGNGRVTPKQGLEAAMVVRHEIEHSITGSLYDTEGRMWLEEATADVIAKWPGEAARTAELLGLPYPKAARTKRYEDVGPKKWGYPEYVTSLRTILELARIDTTSVKDFAAADELLQKGATDEAHVRLAEAIVEARDLNTNRTDALAKRILNVLGEPASARTLARDVRAWQRADA